MSFQKIILRRQRKFIMEKIGKGRENEGGERGRGGQNEEK